MEKYELLAYWETELLSAHRWGRGEVIDIDNSVIYDAWNKIPKVTDDLENLVYQIISLEICNWRLLEFIPRLENAIENMKALPYDIGHGTSLTDDRKKKVWLYWLSLKDWISRFNILQWVGSRVCFEPIIKMLDPEMVTYKKIHDWLGEGNKNKEELVEILCIKILEKLSGDYMEESFWENLVFSDSPEKQELKRMWRRNDPEFETAIMKGGLEFCHHKFFRRLDIIISSIGVEKWRGVIPLEGDHGLTLNEEIDKALEPTITKINEKLDGHFNPFSDGEYASEKLFLRLLLVSLIESQQERAEGIVERNMGRGNN